ncbi:rhomboid family intramembrane serine protease [Spirochaetota bacterium]
MRNYSRGPSFNFLGNIPSATKILLFANIILFLLQNLVPSLTNYFALSFRGVFLKFQIWQIGTYMFLHGSFLHIFFNMFVLLMVGRELESYWGKNEFLKYFFFCGIGAGVSIFLLDLFFYLNAMYFHFFQGVRAFYPTVGASGAILGLLLAYGLFFPDRQVLVFFIIPMRMKYFLILIGVISLFFILFGGGGNISHVGHFGGIISGIIYFKIKKRYAGFSAGNATLEGFWESITGSIKGFFTESKGRSSTSYYSGHSSSQRDNAHTKDTSPQSGMSESEEEAEVDRILDKISREGLDSLSLEERQFLDRVARKYKNKF